MVVRISLGIPNAVTLQETLGDPPIIGSSIVIDQGIHDGKSDLIQELRRHGCLYDSCSRQVAIGMWITSRLSFMLSEKWWGGGVYCGGSVIPRESRARAPYAEYGRHVCLRNAKW